MRASELVAVGSAVVLCALIMGGCVSEDVEQTSEDRPPEPIAVKTCVSIPPQAYLVEQIGGDRVSVEVLVGPGQSPATYEPSPAQMAALDDADVYFRIGVPFEDALMERIAASVPDLNVVDLRKGIELRPIVDHDDGHGHGRMDPHTWLDPRLAAKQAETIHRELARLDPDGAAIYTANAQALHAELTHLDLQVTDLLAPVAGRRIFVFHPSFGYFADAYGLEQVAVEVAGHEPAPRELQRLIELAHEEGLRAIFVQREFSDASARAIAAETGAAIVTLDPLARDYTSNLREMARQIREALLDPGEEQ